MIIDHLYYQKHMSHPKDGEGASDYVTGVLGEVHLHTYM